MYEALSYLCMRPEVTRPKQRLPPQVLLEMPMLTLLDLSDNALTEAPEALFSLCPHLVSLNLEVLSLLALPVQQYKH